MSIGEVMEDENLISRKIAIQTLTHFWNFVLRYQKTHQDEYKLRYDILNKYGYYNHSQYEELILELLANNTLEDGISTGITRVTRTYTKRDIYTPEDYLRNSLNTNENYIISCVDRENRLQVLEGVDGSI